MVKWEISKFRISLLVVLDRRRLSMLMKLIGIIVQSICLATHICRVGAIMVRCEIDTLVQSTDKTVVKGCRQKISDAIGDKLVVSAFGLNPYEKNRRGIFDFVGDRYVDNEGRLYWRLGGIETEIPLESLDTWLVEQAGETVCAILNPVAQLGAYLNRSAAGLRPKDEEKVAALTSIVMPNDKISDIPAAYREQHLAFLEQSQKVAEARKKLGWFGLKAGLLSFLERQEWAVRLAQGELDGVLSGFVGKT